MTTHFYRTFDWPEDFETCTLEQVLAAARARQRMENSMANEAARKRAAAAGHPPVLIFMDTLQGHSVLHKRLTWKGKLRRLLGIRRPGDPPDLFCVAVYYMAGILLVVLVAEFIARAFGLGDAGGIVLAAAGGFSLTLFKNYLRYP